MFWLIVWVDSDLLKLLLVFAEVDSLTFLLSVFTLESEVELLVFVLVFVLLLSEVLVLLLLLVFVLSEVLVLGFPDEQNEPILISPDFKIKNGGKLY